MPASMDLTSAWIVVERAYTTHPLGVRDGARAAPPHTPTLHLASRSGKGPSGRFGAWIRPVAQEIIVLLPVTGPGARTCRTLTAMTISDSREIDVRRTSAYRAAVWCQRLSYVCVVIWIFIGFRPHPASSDSRHGWPPRCCP